MIKGTFKTHYYHIIMYHVRKRRTSKNRDSKDMVYFKLLV